MYLDTAFIWSNTVYKYMYINTCTCTYRALSNTLSVWNGIAISTTIISSLPQLSVGPLNMM